MRKKERTLLNRALSVHHSTETPKRKGPELFDVRKELEKIFKTMDAKRLKISEKEILDEIAAVRRERRRSR